MWTLAVFFHTCYFWTSGSKPQEGHQWWKHTFDQGRSAHVATPGLMPVDPGVTHAAGTHTGKLGSSILHTHARTFTGGDGCRVRQSAGAPTRESGKFSYKDPRTRRVYVSRSSRHLGSPVAQPELCTSGVAEADEEPRPKLDTLNQDTHCHVRGLYRWQGVPHHTRSLSILTQQCDSMRRRATTHRRIGFRC